MTTVLVIAGESVKETPEQARKRLATELRLIQQQYNSKLMEVLDMSGMSVSTKLSNGEIFEDAEGILLHLEVNHQTPAKHY